MNTADIEVQFPLLTNYRRYVAFMLDCVNTVAPALPELGVKGYETALRYWKGAAGRDELEKARVATWKYLDGESTAPEAPSTFAMRAVVSVLYPDPPSDDGVELLDWFVRIVVSAGCPSSSIERLMQTHFVGQ
jgi:hypothetical protein